MKIRLQSLPQLIGLILLCVAVYSNARESKIVEDDKKCPTSICVVYILQGKLVGPANFEDRVVLTSGLESYCDKFVHGPCRTYCLIENETCDKTNKGLLDQFKREIL